MDSPSSSKLRTFVVIGFVLCLLIWICWPSTPEATPGNQPAAPPKSGEQSAFQVGEPTEGIVVPHLSASDLKTLKSGKAVVIDVPGGGTIELSNTKPKTPGKK